MFQIGFSFPLSRLFRFRRRRAAKASASANIAQASLSAPPPRHPVTFHPETTSTNSEAAQGVRTTIVSPLPGPIAHSPVPAYPDTTLLAGAQAPSILIIEKEDSKSLPAAPAPPGVVGPQIPVNGVSTLAAPPAPNTRRVSFQLHAVGDGYRAATPLSTCSTLVETDAETDAETEPTSAVPQERPCNTGDLDSIGIAFGDAEPVAELPGVMGSGLGRTRHKSLLISQPVRVNVDRLSLPAPVMTASTNKRYSRRESKRASLFIGSSPNQKEKRMTRWSREMNKPEMQEVLKTLSGF